MSMQPFPDSNSKSDLNLISNSNSEAPSLSGPMIDAYLERIGYAGERDVTLETLRKLQECHVHTVPYETLDVVNRVPISLNIPDLYDKIVLRRRGGYCFEQNALFGALLQALGFQVKNGFGRFWRDETALPPKRRHQILQIELQGQSYLADVGAGAGSPMHPIAIIDGGIYEQGTETYRFSRDERFGWVLEERKRQEWSWVYTFTEEAQLPIDFIAASFWCQHSPDSPFPVQAMASIRTERGRNTLLGREFKTFRDGIVTVETSLSDEEYRAALWRHFNIQLS